jgi:hypothetical protein
VSTVWSGYLLDFRWSNELVAGEESNYFSQCITRSLT